MSVYSMANWQTPSNLAENGLNWQTYCRDYQLLDEPRDHFGESIANAQY